MPYPCMVHVTCIFLFLMGEMRDGGIKEGLGNNRIRLKDISDVNKRGFSTELRDIACERENDSSIILPFL